MVVELGEKDFSGGLSFVTISQVETLQGLAFHTCFDQETDFMLMLNEDNEHYIQLGFQLNTYSVILINCVNTSYHRLAGPDLGQVLPVCLGK